MRKKCFRYVIIIKGYQLFSEWFDASSVILGTMCINAIIQCIHSDDWFIEYKDVEE